MTPRVLMLCADDWANVGYAMSQAYLYAGIPISAYKLRLHAFNYEQELPLLQSLSRAQADKLFAEADILHFLHSSPVTLQGWDVTGKKVICQHGGTKYREHHDEVNATLEAFDVRVSLIETPDLLGLGAVNEILFPPPVDTFMLRPRPRLVTRDVRVVGHFPSTVVKGTRRVQRVFDKLAEHPRYATMASFRTSDPRAPVSHSQHIERMSVCDVIVDVAENAIDGRRYGEYGVSGREAAALGCVVVSAHLHKDRYEAAYGDTEIVTFTNEDELEFQLRRLFDLDPVDFEIKRAKTRKWIEEKHSVEAVAERLKALVASLRD